MPWNELWRCTALSPPCHVMSCHACVKVKCRCSPPCSLCMIPGLQHYRRTGSFPQRCAGSSTMLLVRPADELHAWTGRRYWRGVLCVREQFEAVWVW